MHESGQEYMEGMWESVTIERSAAGQPGILVIMERRDGDLMEDQMVVHIKDGRKFLEHVIEWLGRDAGWAVRDDLTGAIYRQPNKLIAEKVAAMHGNSSVLQSGAVA